MWVFPKNPHNDDIQILLLFTILSVFRVRCSLLSMRSFLYGISNRASHLQSPQCRCCFNNPVPTLIKNKHRQQLGYSCHIRATTTPLICFLRDHIHNLIPLAINIFSVCESPLPSYLSHDCNMSFSLLANFH